MRYSLLLLISAYKILSPLLQSIVKMGGAECHCKFPVTCSDFVRSEIKTNPNLLDALRKSLIRILNCGPWSAHFIRN